MKRATTVSELREEMRTIKTNWSRDTAFAARALMLIAEQLERIEKKLVTRSAFRVPPRPSKWQQFFAAGMKSGKTPAQISVEWRALKERRAA